MEGNIGAQIFAWVILIAGLSAILHLAIRGIIRLAKWARKQTRKTGGTIAVGSPLKWTVAGIDIAREGSDTVIATAICNSDDTGHVYVEFGDGITIEAIKQMREAERREKVALSFDPIRHRQDLNEYMNLLCDWHGTKPKFRTHIHAEFTGRNEEDMTAQEWMDENGLKVGDEVRVKHGLFKHSIGRIRSLCCGMLNVSVCKGYYNYNPRDLEPVTPTCTLDTAAIKKRFGEAVVICDKGVIAIAIPLVDTYITESYTNPGNHLNATHADVVTGMLYYPDYPGFDWIIKPGDKCTDRTGNFKFTYTGFSGDLEYPFAGIDPNKGKDCFRSIRPLPSPTPEQKQRQKRIEKLEQKIERTVKGLENISNNLAKRVEELARLKNS